ncbi:hypothetical protein [Stackebrandtia soli]|uniref:hypothetical protein n=1 Tax=Stackebrandtia soli TaxID=1892856 RepID=UPI0039EB3F5B
MSRRDHATVTELDAYAVADELVSAAVGAITAKGFRVRIQPGLRNAIPLDAGGIGDAESVNVEVSYQLEFRGGGDGFGDMFDRTEPLYATVEAWWRTRGYAVVLRQLEPPFRALRARDPASGFAVSLKQGRIGNLWLTVSSPPARATHTRPPPSTLLP